MAQNQERKYFGTDGIRGESNTPPMTAEIALKVAMAVARYFRRQHPTHKAKVVIGKDTRLSGYMLENAMTAGFVSMGMDVIMVGPMPTPAIAMLTRSLRADLGVMISASHNPYQDNGIKLFGADGYKLSDEVELKIEALMAKSFQESLASSDAIGRAMRVDEESGRYVEHVKASFPKNLDLHGLKIVVDCANGAAYKAAPKILFELGAEVIPIGVNPNGKNINHNCGATATQNMQDTVVAQGADIGLALDGDADRLIVADELGQRVDGDQIIAVIARDLQERELLNGGGVVATVMSNLGLERYLKSINLHLKRTPVGDRYVMAAMQEGGYNLGGEQSGHFIALDHSNTGDGLIASLQVLAFLKRKQVKASQALHVFEPVPQELRNVRYDNDNPLDREDIQSMITKAQTDLTNNKKGRLLVRASGTEPVIRVMVESDNTETLQTVLNETCAQIEQAI